MKFRRMPIEIEAPEEMGDLVKYNLTESSYKDQKFQDLNLDFSKITFFYGPHSGGEELRKLIAMEGGLKSTKEVLVTPGASAALFLIATSLLKKGDHVVVQHPNYGSNIETPRLLECEVDLVTCYLENNFQITLDAIKKKIKSSTKLISITTPHNPTGAHTPRKVIEEIAAFAAQNKIYLIVDETYRDLNFVENNSYASALNPYVVSVSSLSKAYGLPGIRMGWLTTANAELMETFLAAKEQVFITGSVLDEEVAIQILRRKKEFLVTVKNDILEHRKITLDWLATEPALECMAPTTGVFVFPRIKKKMNVASFYERLNKDYGTYVGPGHWFEMPDEYFRLGYCWGSKEDLSKGLVNISAALKG